MLPLQLPSELNPLGTGGKHHIEKLAWRKFKKTLLIIIEFSNTTDNNRIFFFFY